MKKILVFGGHGFLGKNLKSEFDNSNHIVHYVSRRDGIDLTDEDSVMNTLKMVNPDFVIHAAAHVGSINYVSKNSTDIIQDNSKMNVTDLKTKYQSFLSTPKGKEQLLLAVSLKRQWVNMKKGTDIQINTAGVKLNEINPNLARKIKKIDITFRPYI